MPETPDRVFTIATTEDDTGQKGQEPVILLFTSLSGDPEIQDDATRHFIMHDPALQKLIGGGAVILESDWSSVDDGGHCWEVRTDIGAELIEDLEAAKKGDKALVYDPSEGIREIDLYEVYYGCTLPHKSILGCRKCFYGEENPRDCSVKKLQEMNSGIDAEDSFAVLKNRVSKIGGFTYISPRLTSTSDFVKTFRPPDEHEFSAIAYKSELIQKGLQERRRFNNFEKAACSQCFVRKVCHSQRERNDRRGCPGPYPQTEGDAVVEVLKKVKIPFSDDELNYLLANSYELNKRYRHCKYWTTFVVANSTLEFGVQRHTRPYSPVETFDTYAEAENFIIKYGEDIQTDQWDLPVSPVLKAVLIELAARDRSPVHRGNWRSTEYGKLAVVHAYRNLLRCKFAFNGGGRVTGFSAEAECLADVYKHWEGFRYVQQTYHEDRHTYAR